MENPPYMTTNLGRVDRLIQQYTSPSAILTRTFSLIIYFFILYPHTNGNIEQNLSTVSVLYAVIFLLLVLSLCLSSLEYSPEPQIFSSPVSTCTLAFPLTSLPS